jgi:hypothetical protein
MSKSSYKIIMFIVLIILLGSLIVVSVFVFKNYVQSERYQLFCVSLRPGISKNDVTRILDEHGTYDWRDDYVLAGWSYLYFDNFETRIILGNPIVLRFDNEGRLIAAGSRGKVADEIQIECDK